MTPPASSLPTRGGRRRALAMLLGPVLAAAVLAGSPSGVGAQVATPVEVLPLSADATTVELQGRGWGHGIGMGQWGALGYATQHNWTYTQILDHYYGNTTMGTRPNDTITVRLLAHDNQATHLYLAEGSMVITDLNGNPIAQSSPAIRFRRIAPNTFEIADAPSCAGPWSVRQGTVVTSTIRVNPSVQNGTVNQSLGVCLGSGNIRWYRGELRAVADPEGIQRTVNALPLEQYLRGVVPRESPASWGNSGEGKGMHALRAQAVAARTYAATQNRYSYARTCDSASCQVYGGLALRQGDTTTVLEHPNTDQAVIDTAGQIRERNGTAVSTMYSASTGGYTAYHSSVGFPAVPDLGDSVSPRHTWTRSVSVAMIETRYNRGTLQRIEILSRNGLGPEGGRIEQMRLVFSGGNVELSGSAFRSAFFNEVWSDWFTPVGMGHGNPVAEPLVIPCPEPGLGGLQRLYQAYFLRAPDAGGFAHWTGELNGGRSLASISGYFAGSPEFVARYGQLDHTQFVELLYTSVLNRTAEPTGKAYWIDLLETRKQGRGGVMLNFSNSAEYKSMTGNCA
jgi:SpoIID/LytB domain protein